MKFQKNSGHPVVGNLMQTNCCVVLCKQVVIVLNYVNALYFVLAEACVLPF